jgi:hypothetical protein
MSKKIKRIIITLLFLVTIIIITVVIVNSIKTNNLAIDQSKNSIENGVSSAGVGYLDSNSTAPSIVNDIPKNESYTKQDPTKIIKNSNITMQTDNYDTSLNNIKGLIQSTDSMIVKMQESQGSIYSSSYLNESKLRTTEIIVKVAKDKFETFNNEVKKHANVISYNEETQDISSSYSDIEAKIESYKIQEKQLNVLLTIATAAKDLLEISNEIQKVIQEREYLQRQKNSYDNQIEYSTVYISLTEVKSTVIKEKNIFVRMFDIFKMSLIQIKDICVSTIIVIVYFIPYVIVLGIILLIIYVIIKRKKNRK